MLGGKKVVLASSIAFYGTTVEDEVEESTAFGSTGVSPAFGAYAASKLMGEHLGRLYAQKYGVEFCAVRFSTVYGENRHSRGVNALYILEALDVRSGRAPKIRGDGMEAHDYIHAAEAALRMVMAMEKGRRGESYNLSTDRATSVKEIVDLVLKECGSTLTLETITDTRDVRSTHHADLRISNAKARQELEWAPAVTIADGIGRLLRWMESTQENNT